MITIFVHTCTDSNAVPVSTDRQPVAQEFIGHVELVVLCILSHTFKVLQLDTHDHVFGFCQQVDIVITQPELTSTAEKKAEGRGIDCKKSHLLVYLNIKLIQSLKLNLLSPTEE